MPSILFMVGKVTPTGARTVTKFSRAFFAPQTTLIIFKPSNTSQIFSLSAFGCLYTFLIKHTLKSLRYT